MSSTRPSLSSYPHSRVRVTLSQGADRDISLGVWVDGTFQHGVSMFGWAKVETYREYPMWCTSMFGSKFSSSRGEITSLFPI